MSTLFLLRHGAIIQHAPRRFIGQTDHPLTDDGRRQAGLWRDVLADVPFTAVAASDLSRCRETAAIVLGGRDDVPIRLDPRLREIALGAFEGLTVEEVRSRYPGAYERRGCDIAGFCPQGGESFAEVQARAVAAKLRQDKRIVWFEVESENMESIHNHNAYAMVVSTQT